MKLEEHPQHGTVLYIHQSDLNTARMCPDQLRKQMTGEYFDPDSDAAFIGTRMHSFVEFCLNAYQVNGEWPDPVELMQQLQREREVLIAAWPNLWQHPHQIRDLEQALGYLEHCCVLWFNKVIPNLDLSTPDKWLIEFPFKTTLLRADDYTVILRGHIDFWDGRRIIDWKTSAFREIWRKERYDIQSSVYTYGAACQLGLSSPVEFHLVSVPRDKDEPQWVDLTRGSAHWGAMQKEAIALAKMAMTLGPEQEWPLGPTDWWCSERWCSEHAQGKCLGKLLPVYPEEAVYLTSLVERGVKPRRHDSTFDEGE